MRACARLVSVLLAACLLLLAARPAKSITWFVPSAECPTIQSGLDRAGSGDEVQVAAGRYHEILFWPFQNGIVLRGAGTDSTSVVGDGEVSVLYFADVVQIDSTTVIEQIRFCHGGDAGVVIYGCAPKFEGFAVDSTAAGPGICCAAGSEACFRSGEIRWNSGNALLLDGCGPSLTVSGCLISQNGPGHAILCQNGSGSRLVANTIRGTISGTGIHGENSSPEIVGNIITGNDKGGIFLSWSNSLVRDNDVTANSIASESGAGISIFGGSPQIISNRIVGNTTSMYGGGLLLSSSSALISGNQIAGNQAGYGGGIGTAQSHDRIVDNEILDNTATGLGGGISAGNSNLIIQGNLIGRNHASRGAGIEASDPYGSPVIRENRVVENDAWGDGGGISIVGGSATVQFLGNTVAGNHSGGNGGGYCFASGTSVLSQETVAANHADGSGDGLYTISTSPTVSGCNIADNGWGVHNASYQIIPDLRGNWWGDLTGPWHQANPAGQGDSLSIYAWNFVPWLAHPDTTAPPPPPRNLAILEAGPTSLRLAWDPLVLDDLSGYRVYIDSDSSGFPYATHIDVGNVHE